MKVSITLVESTQFVSLRPLLLKSVDLCTSCTRHFCFGQFLCQGDGAFSGGA